MNKYQFYEWKRNEIKKHLKKINNIRNLVDEELQTMAIVAQRNGDSLDLQRYLEGGSLSVCLIEVVNEEERIK